MKKNHDILRFFQDITSEQSLMKKDIAWLKWGVGMMYPLMLSGLTGIFWEVMHK